VIWDLLLGFNSEFEGLNDELNPICHLLALLGAHPIFNVSRIRVKMPEWIKSILFCDYYYYTRIN
jgi:hypothetical protein